MPYMTKFGSMIQADEVVIRLSTKELTDITSRSLSLVFEETINVNLVPLDNKQSFVMELEEVSENTINFLKKSDMYPLDNPDRIANLLKLMVFDIDVTSYSINEDEVSITLPYRQYQLKS